jgi:hypothetical protein
MSSSNSKDKQIENHYKRDCNAIFGIIYELKLILDVNTFRKWLRENHGMKDDSEILLGYQFMTKTLIGSLINAIDSNSSFELEEDFAFHRAMHYVGLELNKMLNTCEKAIFVKNIFELAKPIWRTKSWNELKKKTKDFSQNCISIFDRINQNHVSVSKQLKIGKDDAVKNIAIFYALVQLTDTHRGIPKGYISSIFMSDTFRKIDFDNLPEEKYTKEIPKEKLEYSRRIFHGYKYALQFLWFSLLKKDIFNKYLSEMHLAEDWDSPHDIVFSNDGLPMETTVEGHYLDNYFGIVNEKIVRPIEKKTGLLSVFSDICIIEKSIPKKDFGILLTGTPKDPKYTEEEYLNYRLYWYQAEILESSHVFNGVAAFVPVLIGLVENRKMMGIKEKISVARFKHPQYIEGQNNYSYGILIEAVSNILADYSGWIIFYDCATDHSGFGGFEHSLAESYIDIYQKTKKINVIEIKISTEKLLKYLKGNTVTKDIKKIVDNWEYLESNEAKLGESKGLLLELLLFYVLSDKDNEAIIWDYRQGDIQIDVITKKDNKVHFFECKTKLHTDINKECNSFKNNVKNLMKNITFIKEMNISNKTQHDLSLCFWEKPPKSIIDAANSHGIRIIELSDYFNRQLPQFRRIKKNRLELVLSEDRKNI